jgi:hypothetical protein
MKQALARTIGSGLVASGVLVEQGAADQPLSARCKAGAASALGIKGFCRLGEGHGQGRVAMAGGQMMKPW